MKGKRVQIFLVIAIPAAIVLVFSACLRSSNLAGVRLLIPDPTFEKPGQDNTLSYPSGQPKAFVSTVFTMKWLPETILLDPAARFRLLAFFPDQKALLLRC
jgi:hypothetical protein